MDESTSAATGRTIRFAGSELENDFNAATVMQEELNRQQITKIPITAYRFWFDSIDTFVHTPRQAGHYGTLW